MSYQHRICFVICYYGRWPEWMSFYLESCRQNPSVDFLFFTDCGAPANLPRNVTMIDSTLAQFQEMASKKLGQQLSFKNTYKLCDYKPAFGVIFSEFLKGYEFWGNADIDIIYGRIRDFLTEEMLGQYDVITSRSEYLAGHMTLYRNIPDVNRLYEKSTDYPRVLQEETHFSFCECSKLWRHLHDGGSIFDTCIGGQEQAQKDNDAIIDSMTHVVTRLQNSGLLRVSFSTMIKDRPELQGGYWNLRWKHGVLSDTKTGEQFLYIHMIGLKDNPDFQIPEWEDVPEQFYMTRKGISIDGQLDESLLSRILNALSLWVGRNPYNPVPY